jgi:hypothetical protein
MSTYGRRAYGAHRRMPDSAKARSIARSILEHGYPLATRETYERYGIEDNEAMQALVAWAIDRLEHPPSSPPQR